MAGLEFHVLGPLEVLRNGRPIRLGGERQRALLAILLVHANEVVSSDRLIAQLFGADASETAANTLQVAVSRLRRTLEEEELLVTRPGGYLLRARPEQLDIALFERLLEDGRRALTANDPVGASVCLRDALALWRGPPLADLSLLDFAQPEIRRLEELRLTAVEDRIDADLAPGRDAELVPELEGMVAQNPLQERLRGQLMLALYRAGRQADALEVYRQTRLLLNDELGLEPSRSLQRLERSILQQDDSLEPGARALLAADDASPTPARTSRRRAVLGIGAAVSIAAGAAAALLVTGGSSGRLTVLPNSIAVVAPGSHRVVADVRLGSEPGRIAAAHGSVWVTTPADRTVTEVSVRGVVARTFGVSMVPTDIGAGASRVWVLDSQADKLRWIDLAYGEVGPVLALPRGGAGNVLLGKNRSAPIYRQRDPTHIATGFGAVWVAEASGLLVRVDPHTFRVTGTVGLGANIDALALGTGSVWVTRAQEAELIEIDPRSLAIRQVIPLGERRGELGPVPLTLAAGAGALWTTNGNTGTVARTDPTIGSVTETTRVDLNLTQVAVGAGGAWVAAQDTGTLYRLDPATARIVSSLVLAPNVVPTSVAVADGKVWIGVRDASF